MEVGRYIDFHSTDAAVTDYDVRLDAASSSLFSISTNIYAPSYRFDSAGNASITENTTGTYGTFEAVGKKNAYAGICFSSAYNDVALMFNDSTNECGFWDATAGWRLWCDGANITLSNNTKGVVVAQWGTNAKISRGTAVASGGSDGDVYMRYDTDPAIYANVSGTWKPIAGSAAIGGTFGKFTTSDLVKTSDTALAADTDLDVTLEANCKYRIEYSIYIDTAAAPDLKYDHNFTGTTTTVFVRGIHHVWTTSSLSTGIGATSGQMHGASALNVQRNFTVGGNDTLGFDIIMTIDVGASGGTLSFRWAQAVSSATACTRRKGSAVVVTRIA